MLTQSQLDAIRDYDVCSIVDAIERFGVRLHNEGFTRPGLRCFTEREPRLLGYASTFQIRSSDPPPTGGTFLDRTDWWPDPEASSLPRIAVIKDLERAPLGACIDHVHAALFKALGFNGAITDGAVRDLPSARHMRFPMFAQYVSASQAYMHVVNHGRPVEILGLRIAEGDLIYADCHGVVNIPVEIADQVAKIASQIRAQEARIVQACLSAHLSRTELQEMIQNEGKQ